MNPSLTVKIKIYYFPNIITAHVIIDIFYVSLQNDVVRHCLFWFHMLHCCGLFIHFIFTTSCLHIHHMCGVCICSVCKQSSVVVKSKQCNDFIVFICFCISLLIQRRLSRLFVSVSVCLLSGWLLPLVLVNTDVFPLYNATDLFQPN